MEHRIWRDYAIRLVGIVGIVLLEVLFYAFIHEGSHALVAMLFGGRVTNFEINFLVAAPHVSYVGVSDPLHQALISLAGPVLPLLLVIPFTVLLPRTKNKIMQIILFLSIVMLISTLVGSVWISFAAGLGFDNSKEDLIKFISGTGVNAFVVAGIFFLGLAMSCFFVWRVGKLKEVYLNLRQEIRSYVINPKIPSWTLILTRVVLIGILALLVRNIVVSPEQMAEPSYKSKFMVEFGAGLEVAQFYSFTVTEPITYDFVYSLETKSDVVLNLINLDGDPFPFNNHDRITMYQGNHSVEQAHFTGFTLLAGNYALEAMTAGKASLTMYVDTRAPSSDALQHLELLAEVSAGTFTAESFQEPGYELIYESEIHSGADQYLFSLPSSPEQKLVSAFLVGDCENVTLEYLVDGYRRTILRDFNATVGTGLLVSKNAGEFLLTAKEANAKLYIYVK